MELEQMPQPGPGLCGSDREIFERVWRRVMPEDRPDSPIEVLSEAEYAKTAVRAAPTPVQAPEPREDDCGIHCLGPASAVYGAQLQGFIAQELADCKTYMALARRADRGAGRTLTGMAADEKRHAKRLHTAYFLISGVRYWPMDRAAARLEGAYLSTLRSRFLAEQQGRNAYRSAAEGTSDPCLKELYLELAEEEDAHAWLVRGILEAM